MAIRATHRVQEWNIGGSSVALDHTAQGLELSRDGDHKMLLNSPYHPSFALNIIDMFQATITENLSTNSIDPACVWPRFHMTAENEPNTHIALFGRINQGAEFFKWGIYDAQKKEYSIPTVDPIARDCIAQSTWTNAEYAQRLRASVTRDVNNAVTAVGLHYNRSLYENSSFSCSDLIMHYVSNPTPETLSELTKIGLSPAQMQAQYTEDAMAHFNGFVTQVVGLSNTDSKRVNKIVANLKNLYPTLFQTLFDSMRAQQTHAKVAERDRYASILRSLEERVLGQPDATQEIATALYAQLQAPTNEAFLFVGPTGVGKTELALAAWAMKRANHPRSSAGCPTFNMEKFSSKESPSTLFGSEMSFAGCTDKPLISQVLDPFVSAENIDNGTHVRQVKHIIMLFDEIGNANPTVIQALLTLFDRDNGGYVEVFYNENRVNKKIRYVLTHCLFLGTSNLYQDEIVDGFRRQLPATDIKELFIEWNKRKKDPAKNNMSPEMLARMRPRPFGPIPRGDIYRKLLKSKLPALCKQIQTALHSDEVNIDFSELSSLLEILEQKLYGHGVGIRTISDYFTRDLPKAILTNAAWAPLSDKKIILTHSNGHFIARCEQWCFGQKMDQEFPSLQIF